jgi:SAM-dependent methyltransferase
VETNSDAVGFLDSVDQASELDEHRRQSYALWQKLSERWERGREVIAEPTRRITESLIESLDPLPGQTILDLAAGTGEAGFLAAARLGAEGLLISSDFAPAMVAAAERVGQQYGLQRAVFKVLDAERLALEDASVDGVICRFGYMLMGDPRRALCETRRVLRTGGRLVFCVWGEPQRNPWMTVPGNTMIGRGHMQRRDPDGPGMFRLRDPQKIASLLAECGFTRHVIEERAICHRFEDADALWSFNSHLQGPLALAIESLDEEERKNIRSAIEANAEPFRAGRGYEFPGLVLSVLAQ